MKRYRIDWIHESKNLRGTFLPGPLTHSEAWTIIEKASLIPWRRLLLVQVKP